MKQRRDAEELYLKCFIKNVFDLFYCPCGAGEVRIVRWDGFPELRNARRNGGRHNLAASGIQDGRVSAPFNYGINHANGRPFRSAT